MDWAVKRVLRSQLIYSF